MYHLHIAYNVLNLVPLQPADEMPLYILTNCPVDYFLLKPEFLCVILAECMNTRAYCFDHALGLDPFRYRDELYVVLVSTRPLCRILYSFFNCPYIVS